MNARLTVTVDVGVQAERTVLAWRRTSQALLVVSAMLVRWLGQHGLIVLLPTGFALLLSLACAIGLNKRYLKKRQGIACKRYEPEIGMILLITAGILSLALTASYLVAIAK